MFLKTKALEHFINEKIRYFKVKILAGQLHNFIQFTSGGDDYCPLDNSEALGGMINNNPAHGFIVGWRDFTDKKAAPGEKRIFAVNAENHLIITYTDDTTTDAGEIDITSAVNSVNGMTGDVPLTASDVGALPDNTSIPSKTSDITNDSGFITNAVNNLINYYLKSETYSKSEVNDLIGALSALTLEIVETLPVSDISTSTIYLVPVEGETNVYMQYIYVNNEWAQLGTTQADLTNYYTKTQIDASLLLKQDKLTFDSTPTGASVNPVTSGGVYTALGLKQDTLTFDNTPTENSNNPVKSGGVYSALQNVTIPIATTETAGKVKPDGTSITIDNDGTIHGANTLTAGDGIDITNNVISTDTVIFTGTTAQWGALTNEQKAKYDIVNLTDDGETGDVVDAITNGVMNPPTSNAVFDKFANKLHDARFLTFMTENTTVTISLPTAFRGMCFISAYSNNHDGIIDVRCDYSNNTAVTKLVGAEGITVDTSQLNRVSFTSTGYAVYALMQIYPSSTDAEIVS